ncbi:MAG: Pyruvoyl-dependent arginine decarboxylase PdaD [Candidatus Methanohalarchaeum thermophilum]|uniref:Pyruvoyl-dependent arginine decarboxylase n=1 Tax=Methanohalarchaeum thermophilum TaxID=1903181 RepID=A0A1Q6DUS2_METT1|nr:MAG: Pyruvoyl-dependent arginine decarboxylase PdaD [Candidatus Methanohalarchaeum thermophilum]
MFRQPNKAYLTSGSGTGKTEIEAFDNALLDAGIGNLNLIKVSSIFPKNCRFVEDHSISPGSVVPVVYSRKIDSDKGNLISSSVCVARSPDGIGVVCESSAKECEKESRNKSIKKAKRMLKSRGLKLKDLNLASDSIESEEVSCTVSALLLW